MDRSINLGNIISIVTSDRQKLPARVLTSITVLLLVLAGSPFLYADISSVDAAVNPYGSITISNQRNSEPTSSGSFIFWDTNVSGDSRVYYGLSEADVNNLVNGSWSIWNNNTFNVSIRVSGLAANTTYYYKPQSRYLDVVNDSVPAGALVTLKPGVWTSPSEYMVSPPGWMGSPANFRTVNISAAILTNNGRYVTNLSLEAVIYNMTGAEVGRTNLSGTGPYSGNFTLPDYSDEGGYVVRIAGNPNVAGEFSVLRWGCANCHTSGGGGGPNYPSTFNAPTVHPAHFDTTNIAGLNTVHCADDLCTTTTKYTSTGQCAGSCHVPKAPSWANHPYPRQVVDCSGCHKSPSGGNAALVCENCHGDWTTTESVLAPRYGQDRHYLNATCNDCHNNLTSLNTKPSCTTCHPRPGSILNGTAIPGSIENTSHSLSQTVSCGLCHNREHDVKSLQTLDAKVCRTCHPAINHDGGNQCTTCHGGDPHKITFAGGATCIECHGTNYTGANPMARTTLVDIYAFNESIHRDINASMPRGNLTNDDCWMCHYQKDMNRQNIRKCGDCHRKPSQWHGNANITTNWSKLW